MSVTSEHTDSEETQEDKQFIFLSKLKEQKVIFNKSQVPEIKKEKEKAFQTIAKVYKEIFNIFLTTKQIAKKVSNMKGEVKKKYDLNRTGNKKMSMKPWEKLLMDTLEAERNPVFNKIPGAISIGVQLKSPESCSLSESAVTPPPPPTVPIKKRKVLPETQETKHLNSSELQRLVLLEQLKLVRMQQEEIIQKRKANEETEKYIRENDRVLFKL